jgi:anti-sigma-K factor RskA
MESFNAAPIVRFYGSDVGAQPAQLEQVPEPVPESAPATPPLNLVPPRRAGGPLIPLAVIAGLAAVALATWAFASAVRAADDEPAAVTVRTPVAVAPDPGLERALSLLARPDTQRFRVAGSVGRIVLAVTPGNRGYLVLRGLRRAPAGRVYQAWVIPPAARTIRLGALFRGDVALVPLRARVPEGSAVAITIERAGGSIGPTRTPRLVAVRRP